MCDVRPLDLYPINQLVPIWNLKIRRPFAHWDVVSVFNFGAQEEETVTIDFAEVGLDAEKPYLVYDFWERRLLGRVTGHLSVTVKPQSNRLLALHEDVGRPQFLSTDRHLTQGGTSLRDLAWDASRLTLSGRTELVGGESTRLTFSLPAGFRLQAAAAEGAVTAQTERGGDGTITLILSSRQGRIAAWQLRFIPRP